MQIKLPTQEEILENLKKAEENRNKIEAAKKAEEEKAQAEAKAKKLQIMKAINEKFFKR